jgi:cysteine synthase A
MKLSNQIGNTPLIRISEKIYAKAELFNPTGSIKDRPASYIINDAEKRKVIKPGDTIIEATSGNMGISFAWLAAERGYNCKIVMPSNMSDERKQMLRVFGAELIEVEAGDFDGAIKLRDRLAEENGWFNCNQFHNKLNIKAHEETTAREIIEQVSGRNIPFVSAFVSGTGTGGTLMGAGLKVKERFPIAKIIAVEPSESPVMSGGEPGLHGIQGIGDGSKFLVDLKRVDKIITISTEEATERAKRLAREHGIFVGISAGANVLASEKWVEDNDPDGIVITFLCDRGERYLSCI